MCFVVVQLFGINSLDLYSSGVTLQAMGVPVRRYHAVLLDSVICLGITFYAVFDARFSTLLKDFVEIVIVWIAPWCGIYLTDWLLRRRRCNAIGAAGDGADQPVLGARRHQLGGDRRPGPRRPRRARRRSSVDVPAELAQRDLGAPPWPAGTSRMPRCSSGFGVGALAYLGARTSGVSRQESSRSTPELSASSTRSKPPSVAAAEQRQLAERPHHRRVVAERRRATPSPRSRSPRCATGSAPDAAQQPERRGGRRAGRDDVVDERDAATLDDARDRARGRREPLGRRRRDRPHRLGDRVAEVDLRGLVEDHVLVEPERLVPPRWRSGMPIVATETTTSIASAAEEVRPARRRPGRRTRSRGRR